jgi:hypothetical protein
VFVCSEVIFRSTISWVRVRVCCSFGGAVNFGDWILGAGLTLNGFCFWGLDFFLGLGFFRYYYSYIEGLG